MVKIKSWLKLIETARVVYGGFFGVSCFILHIYGTTIKKTFLVV